MHGVSRAGSTRAARIARALGIALIACALAPTAHAQEADASVSPTATEATEASEPAAPAPARLAAIQARLQLKVVRASEARQAIVDAAQALGGFATFIGSERLTLRVPPDTVTLLTDAVAQQGLVLARDLGREDLTERTAQLAAGLAAKLELLARLRKLLDDSNVSATLAIEKEMTALVLEVESIKGQLHVATDRVRYATVEVSLRFERQERPKDVYSPFGWVNSVDLDYFLAEFDQ